MRSYGVIVCFLFIINGIFSAELDSDDTVTVELPKVVQRRRKVKQIRPHWAAQTANDNYRATALGQDVSNWNVNNQQTAQNYGAYGGSPPWNYGNQEQGPSTGQQNGQQSGYYPPTGEQSQNQGSQYPQYPSTGSGGSQRPQPGYPSPSYPTQTGYPQGPQTQYPQRPQPGQGGQSGYPRPPSGQPSQPGYPQRPQPSQPSQPGYPQRPTGSGSGSYQPPSPPGSQPPLPQRPPDNQVFPGSPFYPQIQPGLTGPPEGELESELKKYCRASRGQFAVDTSCSKYVNCWDDVVVEQECAGNLVFSEEKKYCDFPENVNCGNRPYTKVPTEHSGNCSTPFETYRSPTNCGEFFVCAHGVPNRFVCPGGLAYNSDLGVCDYAHRVECNGVPLLPVEETTDPDYPGDYENNYNNNNGANNNNYGNNYGSNNNNNNNKDNENYYGSYGGSANRPYGKKKIIDEDGSKSSESNEHSS